MSSASSRSARGTIWLSYDLRLDKGSCLVVRMVGRGVLPNAAVAAAKAFAAGDSVGAILLSKLCEWFFWFARVLLLLSGGLTDTGVVLYREAIGLTE